MNTMLFEKVDTVFIPVQNIEKAMPFYVDVLGGTPGWTDNNGNYQTIAFGNTSVTLCSIEHKLEKKLDTSLFSLYTTSIEKAHAYIASHGIDVSEVMEEGAAYFIMKDPDCNRIEICSY